MRLEEDSLVPLYQQVIDDLRESIEDGRFSAGQRIPSEIELSERYSVSRITIRRAIEELSNDGYLVKKQGKGTYVTGAGQREKLRQTGPIKNFTEICASTGKTPGVCGASFETVKAERDDAAALGIKPGDDLLKLTRVRTVDGSPVVYETILLPKDTFAFLEDEYDDDELILDTIKRHKSYRPSCMKNALIEITRATSKIADALDVPLGEPLFHERGTLVDEEDAPLFLADLSIVGSAYCFIV
ncbi:MAG: GntR family transcriptional regulator [Atopobiaceae bacterium]|nr:GntR family transcriptional regulator [Atopobiaceae bacterium]